MDGTLLGAAKILLLPPLGLLWLVLLGVVLHRWFRRTGKVVAWSSGALFYVMATPWFGSWSLSLLQPRYVEPAQFHDAQAIVVLGSGTYRDAPEYGGDTVNSRTLVRLRYAARLHRATGKPMLVSGGTPSDQTTPEAARMRSVLTEEFNVPVRWVEDRSVDTFTNALESRQMLSAAGVRRIFLVTHAWHMARARYAFEHAGFEVIPAPTAFSRTGDPGPLDFFPRPSGLLDSYFFFHELAGLGWYALRARAAGH